MNKLILSKSKDCPEFRGDLDVFSDSRIIGSFKKDDKEKTYEISPSEHSLQVGFQGDEGRYFKSNVYFYNGKKDIHCSVYWFGSKLVLSFVA